MWSIPDMSVKSKQSPAIIERDISKEVTCNFCVSRELNVYRIRSLHPARNMIIYVCKTCLDKIVSDLDLLRSE